MATIRERGVMRKQTKTVFIADSGREYNSAGEAELDDLKVKLQGDQNRGRYDGFDFDNLDDLLAFIDRNRATLARLVAKCTNCGGCGTTHNDMHYSRDTCDTCHGKGFTS
jgi:hypothetical protein